MQHLTTFTPAVAATLADSCFVSFGDASKEDSGDDSFPAVGQPGSIPRSARPVLCPGRATKNDNTRLDPAWMLTMTSQRSWLSRSEEVRASIERFLLGAFTTYSWRRRYSGRPGSTAGGSGLNFSLLELVRCLRRCFHGRRSLDVQPVY